MGVVILCRCVEGCCVFYYLIRSSFDETPVALRQRRAPFDDLELH